MNIFPLLLWDMVVVMLMHKDCLKKRLVFAAFFVFDELQVFDYYFWRRRPNVSLKDIFRNVPSVFVRT